MALVVGVQPPEPPDGQPTFFCRYNENPKLSPQVLTNKTIVKITNSD